MIRFPQHPGKWIYEGRCVTERVDPEWFFAKGALQNGPKQFCMSCPVLETCRRWALENREEWGVWGGMTERERRKALGYRARESFQ